jgi:hypothetical protein
MTSDELTWRLRLASELDNLRVATGWAFDAPAIDDVALGVRIVNAFIGEAGFQPSWGIQAWAGAAVSRVEELNAGQRSPVFTLAAYDAFNTGQHVRAAALGASAVAESERFTPALLLALIVVGLLTAAGGDPAGAMAVIVSGAHRIETDGASEWLSCALRSVTAWFAIAVGDFDTASSAARRAAASARLVKSPTLLAHAMSAHARTMSEENSEEALAAAEEAIGLVEAGAADSGYTPALQTAALLRSDRGDSPGAARAMHAAIEYESHTGNRLTSSANITVAVVVLAGQPDAVEAAATLAGAITGPVLGHLPAFLYPRRPLQRLPRRRGRCPRRRRLRQSPPARRSHDLRRDRQLRPGPTGLPA